MSTSNAKILMTLLEIISYFSVTLDLYGQKRLEQLDDRLRQFLKKIKEVSLTKFLTKVFDTVFEVVTGPFRRIIAGVMSSNIQYSKGLRGYFEFLALLAMITIGYSILGKVTGIFLVDFFFAYFIGLIVSVLAILGFGMLLAVLFFIVEYVVDSILRFLLFLFVKLNLSGILLAVGTILFLASKYVSLRYL